jgi:endonuclease G
VIKIVRKLAILAIATAGVVAGISNFFQPSYALTNSGNITALGVALTENFDTLATTSTGIPWADNTTIPGVYSSRTTYNAGTGSSNAGALYSFGVAGAGVVGDRALGSVGSGGTLTVFWGVKLTNNTGTTITSLAIAYTGEQWRNGGATTAAPTVPSVQQTVDFQYRVGATAINTPVAEWSDHNDLDFASPTFGTTASQTLDGNAAANRTAKSSTISVNIPNGQEVWLRWVDIDHAGNDHGLAIDDLSITANGVPVEPAPTVINTIPANGGSNVLISSPISINFSESVHASGAFSIQCPTGNSVAFIPSGSPATSFTLSTMGTLPYGTLCTVTVVADQVSDEDVVDPADKMAANYVFTFTTEASPIDQAPAVTTTSPLNLATNVPTNSNIVINFNESVLAAAGAFAVNCGGLQDYAITASPVSFTLNPLSDLPYSATCTVTATASQITDSDAIDPPDNPGSDFVFSFTTADPPPPLATHVIINEVDSDTPGSDAAEFVELYAVGGGVTALDGLTVVFYNGSNNQVYAAFDLDNFDTDANGYFVLGNPGVPGVDLVFNPGASGALQNGPDAVALFAGNASDFPSASLVTTANLQDAVVYGTDDADATGLLVLLNAGQPQVNEGGSSILSIQRCANGTGGARNTETYLTGAPSPDATNNCPPPVVLQNGPIVISQIYGGGGNTDAPYQNDYVELYNRGTTTVDITGWSLQYAGATGSGWDFSKQPLGGTIAPGNYYLIALGSSDPIGDPLPPANIVGQINMGATNGKVALVDRFDGLIGNCPLGDPHIMDFVGYGSADCKEGTSTAPAADNLTALFRLGNGATDSNRNGHDFITGAPSPRQTEPIIELGPMVLSTDPRANGFNAPRDATIQVTFTEPVNVIGAWFDITCTTTGSHNSATFAGGGQSHYITPNVNFLAGEQCTFTVFKDQVADQDLADSDPNTDTLSANYVWTFTVATGAAPAYPASVHLTMGNPTGAVADTNVPHDYLMEKPEFALSYNRDLGRPNWVSWHLSDEWIGTLERFDTFRADPAVPEDWYRVQSFDYSGSGFDRGHMVPNADRDPQTSVPINQATFLMTNMIPQAPDNNQGPWAEFENYLRLTLLPAHEVYIVAGGVGVGGTGSQGFKTTVAGGKVQVPEKTWKVALVLPKGNNDISRVSCDTRTIAILMPNVQGIRNDPWENYVTTVDAIEALTGYELFSSLPQAIQACVEAGINGNNPPLDTAPPSINCAVPDGLWHADNIALTCAAGDGGSGLANLSDASFTLMTSVVGGVENANASTDSRVVCDVAGNCATAGPIGGIKIDRRDPDPWLVTPPDGAVYQLNKVVAADYSCTDDGSGLGTCAGTVANGAAIDTASVGPKSFIVTATDAVGNSASRSVSYTVAANTISISNVPAQPFIGGSFVPAFSYAGNGVTSVTSLTPDKCTVSGGTVSFVRKGTCTLVAHASATALFDAASGPPQSMEIGKQPATISISNIPASAAEGGSFVPVFAYGGDGTTHVKSETKDVCKVNGGTVKFVGAGMCILTANATPSGNYEAATGLPQSFLVQ